MSSFKHAEPVDLVALCDRAAEMICAHPLISHRFPLERISEAFACQQSHPAGFVKGIVTR